MKLKSGFMLRKVADSYMAVPVGERTQDVSGVIALSETGALLWDKLQQGATLDELTAALTAEYEVQQEQARQDAEAFVKDLREKGWLEDA